MADKDPELHIQEAKNSKIQSEVPTGPHDLRPEINLSEDQNQVPNTGGHSHKEINKKYSKIPVFREKAEKVINRIQSNDSKKPEQRGHQSNSLIPKPLNHQVPKTNIIRDKRSQNDITSTSDDTEDQFDKIYEQCKDDNSNFSLDSHNIPVSPIDPEVDNIFEEIVHENKDNRRHSIQNKEQRSKIPVFRTKSNDTIRSSPVKRENERVQNEKHHLTPIEAPVMRFIEEPVKEISMVAQPEVLFVEKDNLIELKPLEKPLQPQDIEVSRERLEDRVILNNELEEAQYLISLDEPESMLDTQGLVLENNAIDVSELITTEIMNDLINDAQKEREISEDENIVTNIIDTDDSEIKFEDAYEQIEESSNNETQPENETNIKNTPFSIDRVSNIENGIINLEPKELNDKVEVESIEENDSDVINGDNNDNKQEDPVKSIKSPYFNELVFEPDVEVEVKSIDYKISINDNDEIKLENNDNKQEDSVKLMESAHFNELVFEPDVEVEVKSIDYKISINDNEEIKLENNDSKHEDKSIDELSDNDNDVIKLENSDDKQEIESIDKISGNDHDVIKLDNNNYKQELHFNTNFEEISKIESRNKIFNEEEKLPVEENFDSPQFDRVKEDIIIPKGKVSELANKINSNEFLDKPILKNEVVMPKRRNILQKKAMFEQARANESKLFRTSKSFISDKPKSEYKIYAAKSAEITLTPFNFEPETLKPIIIDEVLKTEAKETEEVNTEIINETEIKTTEEFSPPTKIEHSHKKDIEVRTNLNRIKSVSEKDVNYSILGNVNRIIERINSMEHIEQKPKEHIGIKELPRKRTVLNAIALFENKSVPTQREVRKNIDIGIPKKLNITTALNSEDLNRKISELKQAKITYGCMENMPRIPLNNGQEMPVLALGTALIDPSLVGHVVEAAIDLGYRAIDTAFVYGNEQAIGEALANKIRSGVVRREDLFIINKLWSTFHRSDLVEKACMDSLQKMGLDYFDLYLIHNPMSFKEGASPIPKIANVVLYSQHDYLEAWLAMEQLVRRRLVLGLGVSNFNSEQLARVIDKGKVKPVINQVECHPYLNQSRLSSFCESKDVKLSCFGVLGSKGTPAEYKAPGMAVVDETIVRQLADKVLMTPAQVLIRYQLQRNHSVVVKTTTAARLWENAQAVDYQLTEEEIQILNRLNKNRRYFNFIGMGDTHKNYPFKIPF